MEWKNKEILKLRNLANIYTYREIAKILNRSFTSVSKEGQRIKIKKRRIYNPPCRKIEYKELKECCWIC